MVPMGKRTPFKSSPSSLRPGETSRKCAEEAHNKPCSQGNCKIKKSKAVQKIQIGASIGAAAVASFKETEHFKPIESKTPKHSRRGRGPPRSKILNAKLGGKFMKRAFKEVKKLLCSDIDSKKGIPCVAHTAINNHPVSNFERPATIQNYFGEEIRQENHGKPSVRYVYGNGTGSSTQGGDPRRVRTRTMTKRLKKIGFHIARTLGLSYDFNHVTVNVSHGMDFPKSSSQGKIGSKLGAHCDQTWSKDGTWDPRMNSQEKGTKVVIVTLFESRELFMRKWHVVEGFWTPTSEKYIFDLDHGSMFVLDELDEQPDLDDRASQYRHGSRFMGNGLSIALVFRRVCNTARFDPETDVPFLSKKEKQKLQKKIQWKRKPGVKRKSEHLDDIYKRFDEEGKRDIFQNRTRTYVKNQQHISIDQDRVKAKKAKRTKMSHKLVPIVVAI